MDTRLFFVVDSLEENEELYETLELAREAKNKLPREAEPRISICFVKNSYREGDNWNYNDQANTFERIKEIN